MSNRSCCVMLLVFTAAAATATFLASHKLVDRIKALPRQPNISALPTSAITNISFSAAPPGTPSQDGHTSTSTSTRSFSEIANISEIPKFCLAKKSKFPCVTDTYQRCRPKMDAEGTLKMAKTVFSTDHFLTDACPRGSRVLRVAVALSGKSGSLEQTQTYRAKRQHLQAARMGYESLRDHVMNPHVNPNISFDVFLASWSPEHKGPLESWYRPVDSKFQQGLTNPKLSYWLSLKTVLAMVALHEKKVGAPYDAVLVSRFDAVYLQDVHLTCYDPAHVWIFSPVYRIPLSKSVYIHDMVAKSWEQDPRKWVVDAGANSYVAQVKPALRCHDASFMLPMDYIHMDNWYLLNSFNAHRTLGQLYNEAADYGKQCAWGKFATHTVAWVKFSSLNLKLSTVASQAGLTLSRLHLKTLDLNYTAPQIVPMTGPLVFRLPGDNVVKFNYTLQCEPCEISNSTLDIPCLSEYTLHTTVFSSEAKKPTAVVNKIEHAMRRVKSQMMTLFERACDATSIWHFLHSYFTGAFFPHTKDHFAECLN